MGAEMYITAYGLTDHKDIRVEPVSGDKYGIQFSLSGYVMLDQSEMETLRYEIESAMAMRDAGAEFDAHAADGTVNDLVHGANSGGKQ
jgi:hypothetical protein